MGSEIGLGRRKVELLLLLFFSGGNVVLLDFLCGVGVCLT